MIEHESHVRMYGDIAVASIEPLSPELIPDYNSLNSGYAFMFNGWTDARLFASVRLAIKGLNRKGHLFGNLDINGSVHNYLLLKNGEEASIPADSDKLFKDENHMVVIPRFAPETFYDRYNPNRSRQLTSLTECKAFALVPYNQTKGKVFVKDHKHAEPFSTTRHWRRYKGLLLVDRPTVD